MLAGSPNQKTPLPYINHKCIGSNGYVVDSPSFPANPELCTVAVRSEVTFPSCWNGVDLDSPPPHSHVAYPVGNFMASPCPSSHPYRLPTVFFEGLFMVDQAGFEAGDSLVYSYNDYEGHGFHGDFVNGWDEGKIESLLDYCTRDYDGSHKCGLFDGKVNPGPNGACQWEGSDDPEYYRGVWDNIPRYN